jgi:hypothetical protein
VVRDGGRSGDGTRLTFSPLTVNDDEPRTSTRHEGNYAIKNILSGSRKAEAAAESSVAK